MEVETSSGIKADPQVHEDGDDVIDGWHRGLLTHHCSHVMERL